MKRVAGVDPATRADHGKPRVIISEKKDKKAAKYLTQDLPYPYTSKAQFEKSMEVPIGTEWNTRLGFQRQTLPRVVKKVSIVTRRDGSLRRQCILDGYGHRPAPEDVLIVPEPCCGFRGCFASCHYHYRWMHTLFDTFLDEQARCFNLRTRQCTCKLVCLTSKGSMREESMKMSRAESQLRLNTELARWSLWFNPMTTPVSLTHCPTVAIHRISKGHRYLPLQARWTKSSRASL